MRGQDFSGLDLRETTHKIPSDVTFISCDFSRTLFNARNLDGLRFQSCTFARTDFTGARLRQCRFEACTDLTDAAFGNVRAQQAAFLGCTLDGRDFSHADLADADFTGSTIIGTDFTHADLARAKGLTPDRTRFRLAALIPPKPVSRVQAVLGTHMDKWSWLRTRFTGLRLFLSLLPVLIFVGTLLGKAVIAAYGTGFGTDDNGLPVQFCALADAACVTLPAWWILLGFEQSTWADPLSWLAPAYVVLALCHNTARFFVTLHVDGLARAEDRTGVCPPWGSGGGYGPLLYNVAFAISLSQWLLSVLFAVNLYELLTIDIQLPASPAE